jgi:serine protease Do
VPWWFQTTSASEKDAGGFADRPSFVELYKLTKPAVVNIRTTKVVKGRDRLFDYYFGPQMPAPFGEDFFERFFEQRPQKEHKERSLGSGFIISADGYILTNNHVVEEADKIKVRLSNEKEFDARVVGKDPKTDIALIKVEASERLHTLQLGDSDALEVGEWVMAIGNPFGFEHSVTVGVVSAKGRVIGLGSAYDDFIQTDASINPGNSGGPLINTRGEVVGINTAMLAQAQGIGFATPINMAEEILPQLKDKGRVVRGWLGVMVQKVTPDLAEKFGLGEGKGALVSKVEPGSPADRSGIKEGDIIIKFERTEISEMNELPRVVARTPVGKKTDVVVFRGGKEKTLNVELGEMPDAEVSKGEQKGDKSLGMTVEEFTPEVANRLGIEDKEGVIVTGVEPESGADDAGIRTGDVIKEVNRQTIGGLKEYLDALDKVKAEENILFFIKRGNDTLFLVVKPEEPRNDAPGEGGKHE